MTPAAYHRQVERGMVTRRFIDPASRLLTLAMAPLIAGVSIDSYLLARLILGQGRRRRSSPAPSPSCWPACGSACPRSASG